MCSSGAIAETGVGEDPGDVRGLILLQPIACQQDGPWASLEINVLPAENPPHYDDTGH